MKNKHINTSKLDSTWIAPLNFEPFLVIKKPLTINYINLAITSIQVLQFLKNKKFKTTPYANKNSTTVSLVQAWLFEESHNTHFPPGSPQLLQGSFTLLSWTFQNSNKLLCFKSLFFCLWYIHLEMTCLSIIRRAMHHSPAKHLVVRPVS